ncbi:MAG: hypothetical protein AAF499_01600 [Pseudomonadota bacterium]
MAVGTASVLLAFEVVLGEGDFATGVVSAAPAFFAVAAAFFLAEAVVLAVAAAFLLAVFLALAFFVAAGFAAAFLAVAFFLDAVAALVDFTADASGAVSADFLALAFFAAAFFFAAMLVASPLNQAGLDSMVWRENQRNTLNGANSLTVGDPSPASFGRSIGRLRR